jgi:CRP-like cAMP-binding protein/Zn-dependent protease
MVDVWEILRSRLDYASFVPTPLTDIERADLTRRGGGRYTVIKNPHGDSGAGRYLRLEPEDVALLELMDGRRSVQEILVAHLERAGMFAVERLARLTAAMRTNGFFGEEPPPLYEKLRALSAQRDLLTAASKWLKRLVLWDIARWSNADRFVDRVYRLIGWLAFTRIGATLLILFGLLGLVLWFQETRLPNLQLLTLNGSYVLGLLMLTVLQVVSISIHEAGHALAIRHFGRRVRRFGFAMYYLFPCCYVDSTDMSLASRWKRVIVSLAGPFAGLVVAAACAVVAWVVPDTVAGEIAFKGASLLVFQFVLNLLPILDLDGYHVLVDALDAPLLRQRALAFARGQVLRKLQRRTRWTREEIGLASFGIFAILISLATLLVSLLIWRARIVDAASELLTLGIVGILVLALIGLVFIGPLAVAVAARGVGTLRMAARLAAARRARVAEQELAERVHVLARVRFLAGLPRSSLAAMASHQEVERFETGQIVFTAGDAGDRFYLVRSGRLQAIAPDGSVFGTIVPGEGFGELALLDRSERSATVEALEPVELWSLRRGHFNRWVAERYEIAARIRASRGERTALSSLPFFRGLNGQELDRISARMRTVRFAPDEVIFSAGDPGDRYYVIREGKALVTLPGGRTVRTLGPGDTFGELALLFSRPRTATVTAVGSLVVAALEQVDFVALVRASGEKAGDFRARTGHYVGAGLGEAVAGS